VCYVQEAKAAVEKLHRCAAVHVETIPVCHARGKVKVWEGEVEVFALEGTKEADCCFVWSYIDQRSTRREFISVPAVPPILTPSAAVKAVLEWESKNEEPRRGRKF
jgi:hypothetical protein